MSATVGREPPSVESTPGSAGESARPILTMPEAPPAFHVMCTCASGRKWKNCHGALDLAVRPAG